MNLTKIKALLAQGKRLFVGNRGYEIIQDGTRLVVKDIWGGMVGLYWKDSENKIRFNVDTSNIIVD